MRIAQVAPLYEAVPPKLYGGTERIVHYLTEELMNAGHEVTLFASGDSLTRARLIANVPEAIRLNKNCIDPLTYHIIELQEVAERSHEFDLLHFHIDYLHFPVSQLLNVPCVTTLHGRLDIPDLQPLYQYFPHQKVISISKKQRLPLPQANWVGNVYHGLPKNLLRLGEGKGNYFAFLGRISPEKGIEKAIEIAIQCNRTLKIAAKIDKADEKYFETKIASLLNHPLIEYIGEINDTEKSAFLGNATALLFPIEWEEPFGIVMIEAMACGTPVIAFNRGSVAEVLSNGETGFIVSSIKEAVAACGKLATLSRTHIRTVFEQKYTAERMAQDYVNIYKSIIHNYKDTRKQLL